MSTKVNQEENMFKEIKIKLQLLNFLAIIQKWFVTPFLQNPGFWPKTVGFPDILLSKNYLA